MNEKLHSRTKLLLGDEVMARLASTRVIVFGVGGVGSWCAEALVRSGIGHLTIVDNDVVNASNCNRQLMATSSTIGRAKVEALRERLLDINPDADVTALQMVYSADSAAGFGLEAYDYVIDAIDSLKDKIALILHVTSLTKEAELTGRRGPVLFSSTGAALRIDPAQVRVAEFWKVRNDTLAAVLRKKMRRAGTLPSARFLCVYSEEIPMPNRGESAALEADAWSARKACTNGSLAHITGIFGFTLAGLVMKDVQAKASGAIE